MHADRRWTVPVLLAAVALAAVVAAIGLASRPSLSVARPHGADPHAARDVTLFVICLLIGVVLLASARGRPGYQATTYRLVGACLLIAPLLLVNVVRSIQVPRPPNPGGGATRSATTGATASATGATSSASPVPVGRDLQFGSAASIISLVLTVAALALLAVVAYRLTRRPGRHVAPHILEPPPRDADEVLASATAAIALHGDPRGRVIAAYEAMEAALRGKGAPRDAPQAPLEWIAGLAESHPAAVAPARDLAEIFERARFRSAPVTDADAARAHTALDRLRATLAVRQP